MVAVVIINFNGEQDTLECLASVWASTYEDVVVVVVDNGSREGSAEALRAVCRERFELVVLPGNRGFSGGNNAGIERALEMGADHVLLLNNDTVVDCEMISCLVEACGDNEVVAPYMYYYSDPSRLWFAGGRFDLFGVPRHETSVRGVGGECEYLTGCCMLLPRSVIERVGPWDERYFLYWEDADYSRRLARAGVRMRVVPGAALLHKVSATTGGDRSPLGCYYNCRNKLLFMSESSTPLLNRVYAWGSVIARIFVARNLRRPTVRAVFDYCNGSFGRVGELRE